MTDTKAGEDTGGGRPKKRARTISDLNEEQLQHKRNVDRRAQRAFRQRTKDSIDRLEQQVAQLQQAAEERENRFQHEMSNLRGSNNTLRQCLEQISKLSSNAVRSMVEVNYGERPPVEPDHGIETAELNETDEPVDNRSADVIVEEHNSVSPSGSEDAPQQEHEDDAHKQQPLFFRGHDEPRQQPSPAMPTVAGAVYPSPSASHRIENVSPQVEISSQSDHHIHTHPFIDEFCPNPDLSPLGLNPTPTINTTFSVGSNTSSGSIFTVLPLHVSSTCPLDDILHEFLHTRRDMITWGMYVEAVVGPPKPNVKALLDPSVTSIVHPLCRVMSEVLTTFTHTGQPEKLAFFYLMYKTMRVSHGLEALDAAH